MADRLEIKPGFTYRFTKSGNLVKTVAPTNYCGPGHWSVARIDTGKEMIVKASALVLPDDPNWS